MAIAAFILVCFVLYSYFAYGKCADEAEFDNFTKEYKAWKEQNAGKATSWQPRKTSFQVDPIDRFLDWMCGWMDHLFDGVTAYDERYENIISVIKLLRRKG